MVSEHYTTLQRLRALYSPLTLKYTVRTQVEQLFTIALLIEQVSQQEGRKKR